MSLSINSNIPSLMTQLTLSKSKVKLDTALERISSGLRINSAKDDPAGLAITDRMNSQLRGITQAARNANDGISLAQTTEGALQETTSLLQRMRELAIQAANDTNTYSDRQSIQKEVVNIQEEIERIAQSTSFNNKKLLDGTFGTASFHIGDQANQIIEITTGDARASVLGAYRNYLSGSVETAANITAAKSATVFQGDDINIYNEDKLSTSTFTADSTAKEVAESINKKSVSSHVSATAETLVEISGIANGTYSFELSNGSDTASILVNIADNDLSGMIETINENSGITGVTAAYNSDESGILLRDDDGDTITLLRTDSNTDTWTATSKGDGSATPDTVANEIGAAGYKAASFRGHVLLESENIFSVDDTLGAGQDAIASKATLSQISGINMETQTGASDSVSVIDKAITKIDSIRGELGATQNRLTSTISNLSNVTTNLTASKSRILDADFAAETTILSQNQIIQQAGMAMLSQANNLPETALSLLK